MHVPLPGPSHLSDSVGTHSDARRTALRSLSMLVSAGCLPLGAMPVYAATEGATKALPERLPIKDQSVLTPHDIGYDGYLVTNFGSTKIASARMQFLPKGDQYRIVLRVDSMLADLIYESSGRIDEYGLQPLAYSEQRKVAFKRRRKKVVEYVVSEDPATVNRRQGNRLHVPPGSQDRLSLILQVSLLARVYPELFKSEKEMTIPFARIKTVTSSRWKAARPAAVALDGRNENGTGAGSRLAQKVSRVADRTDSVDVSFWLTANKARLPLILQFSEGGRSLRFVAKL